MYYSPKSCNTSKTYVQSIVNLLHNTPQSLDANTIYHLLLNNGIEFTISEYDLLQNQYGNGFPKLCFYNSYHLAKRTKYKNTKKFLIYFEGFAEVSSCLGLAVPHAWLVNSNH